MPYLFQSNFNFMRKNYLLLLLAALFLGIVNPIFAQIDKVLGIWEGRLSVANTELRILFHIKMDKSKLFAEMDSPDQMQYGIKMDTVIASENGFTLKLAIANAEFVGTYSENFSLVNGFWNQAGSSFPLSMKKNQNFKPRSFPQEPKPPFPYHSEEVSYKNSKADFNIGGSLTMPEKGTQKYPAILLITGSGAQDRDENIMGHKPFLVIADHFSRRGFAVLRVDDRGVGATGGNPLTATTADFVTDVKAGIKFLKAQPNVNPNKIFLMGHSEGGLIAIMTAAEMKNELAGIVLLAAPGVPMSDLIVRQSTDILRQECIEDEYLKAAEDFNRKLYGYVAADKKNKLSAMSLSEKMTVHLKAMPKEAKEALELGEARLFQSCVTVLMPWFRYFIKIEPKPFLKKVKCPVLAINGSMDLQVAAGPNLEAICSELRKKKHKDVICTEIPGLNHLFQRCKSCKITEYGELEETFAPEVLKAMEEWLKKRS